MFSVRSMCLLFRGRLLVCSVCWMFPGQWLVCSVCWVFPGQWLVCSVCWKKSILVIFFLFYHKVTFIKILFPDPYLFSWNDIVLGGWPWSTSKPGKSHVWCFYTDTYLSIPFTKLLGMIVCVCATACCQVHGYCIAVAHICTVRVRVN